MRHIVHDDSRRILFTADPHFKHENIIGMCNRPFSNIQEHDEALIANWNETVVDDDTIIYLVGDFAYKCHPRALKETFERLRGTIVLIEGNHDRKATLALPWSAVHERLLVTVDGQRIVLDHYASKSFYGSSRDVVQFHGHSHGRIAATDRSCDVGVDVWNFRPVSLAEVKAKMALSPPFHHDFESEDDEPEGPKP